MAPSGRFRASKTPRLFWCRVMGRAKRRGFTKVGWKVALRSSIGGICLRVDLVSWGRISTSLRDRGRGCAVSVMADKSASSGGSDEIGTYLMRSLCDVDIYVG